jgi:DNA-binding PucR family transcriptional regulator
LRSLYLEPLERERGGGEAARDALRAYFAADRNVSSAAAMLGVSRQAVAKRLRSVEERLGRSLASCGTELEAALRLEGADLS